MVDMNISWIPPPPSWIKVNTNRALEGIDGETGCSGVCRDDQGRWVVNFVMNIGTCTTFQAELWSVFQKLQTVWVLGFRKVILDLNSQALVEVI
ncbi:hypothetical protein AHAS_Ahas16G0239000 [Arachis hypogaea]